ncbi:MAG: hypothetical protein QXD77_02790 [Candidatus Aenigmatarchaeota archaeon]
MDMNEDERAAIEEELGYFVKQYRSGNRSMDPRDVCSHAAKELLKRGYKTDAESILAVWDEMLYMDAAPLEEKKISMSEFAHRKALDLWGRAKPKGVEYVSKLPRLDAKLEAETVRDTYRRYCEQRGEENAKTTGEFDCLAFLAKFDQNNGRAFDFDLTVLERSVVRKLEEDGLVKLKHYETNIRLEKKGKKPEYKPYTFHYWEPTGKAPETAAKEENEYECYADDGLWKRGKA